MSVVQEQPEGKEKGTATMLFRGRGRWAVAIYTDVFPGVGRSKGCRENELVKLA
jgi:hypothetical protein